jgi:hypothetical protein
LQADAAGGGNYFPKQLKSKDISNCADERQTGG